MYSYSTMYSVYTGADPGFQVRGGALKKIAPSGGRRENFFGVLLLHVEPITSYFPHISSV
jgi:hypothetical protein